MASQSSRKRGPRSVDAGPSVSTTCRPRGGVKHSKMPSHKEHKELLDGPYHTLKYIQQEHDKSPIQLQKFIFEAPRSYLNNFYSTVKGNLPEYATVQGTVIDGDRRVQIHRTTVNIDIEPPIVSIGDHQEKKQSITFAALSACYQLQELGILNNSKKIGSVFKPPQTKPPSEATLSDGSIVVYDQARSFMDYYCRRYEFPFPDVDFVYMTYRWEAIMTVDGRRIGLGSGPNKKSAQTSCYLDVTKYLESCDSELWKTYLEASKSGKDLGLAPKV